MPYFIKYNKPKTNQIKWKKIIDFTKINNGGIGINEILSKL